MTYRTAASRVSSPDEFLACVRERQAVVLALKDTVGMHPFERARQFTQRFPVPSGYCKFCGLPSSIDIPHSPWPEPGSDMSVWQAYNRQMRELYVEKIRSLPFDDLATMWIPQNGNFLRSLASEAVHRVMVEPRPTRFDRILDGL